MFGSDWPEMEPGRSISRVRQLPLSDAAKEAMVGGNAARILGLKG